MPNYTIKDNVITITGELTQDEMSFITGLVQAGLEIKTAENKPKKRKRKGTPNKNKGKNTAYYEKVLSSEQLEEFYKIKKEKSFLAASHWADKQIQ